LLSLLRRDEVSSSPPPATSQAIGTSLRYAVRTIAIWTLPIVALITALVVPASAEEPAGSAAQKSPRVLFPVGNDQQTAGDYVYVEEKLYDELHRPGAVRASGTPGWLLQKASYAVSVAPAAASGGLSLVQLAVGLDFQTLAPSQTVVLPWRRHQVALLQGGARLDAAPADLTWSANGEALLLEVEQSGRHRLELSLAASARQVDEASLLEIDAPKVAISNVNLPAASANATVEDDGSSGLLSIRWRSTGPESGRSEKMAADRLLLWKLRPGSISLESRFQFQPGAGQPREVLLTADSRLRLLPGRASAPVAALKEQQPHSQFRVDLRESTSANTDFRLAWLWPDAIGIGKLSLPDVELRDYRLEHDWIVLSLDPTLELDAASRAQSLQGPQASEAAAEIRRLWPELDLAGAVLVDGRVTPRPIIGVKPTEPTPHAVQTTEWSVSRSLAQATCTARITGLAPTRFEHRIAIPPQVHVSRVGVVQASRPAALRWAQQRDGTVVVSLLEPPASEQTLTVVADLPLPGAGGAASLPAFSLANAVDDQCLVRVYRRSDVQLRLEQTPGWIPDGEASLRQEHSFGRLVAVLKRQSAQSAAPRIVWSANNPQVRASIFTRVDEADGDWLGEVQLRLNVAGGLVDELRLSVPESWSGPLSIEPGMEQHFEASASEARRQLVLRPGAAVSGLVDITIRGPIHSTSGALQAPDVVLVGDHSIDRYVCVNRGNVGQAIDWDVTGLLPIARDQAPDAPLSWRDAPGDIFRVIGQRFDATAKTRSTSAPTPCVSLADMRVTTHLGGSATVEGRMTIEPHGAATATFRLPPSARLITTLLDDVAVPCVNDGVRAWTVSAPTEAAAYRLAILYQTTITQASRDGAIVLAAPQMLGMPVRRALWSVEGAGIGLSTDKDADEIALVTGQRAQTCTRPQVQLARFNSAAASLEATTSAVSANVSRAVLRDSFLRWKAELMSLDQQLAAVVRDGGLSQEEIDQWHQGIDVAAKAQQRLIQAGVLEEEDNGRAATVGEINDATPALHFIVDGAPDDLTLSGKQRSRRKASPGSGIAALVMVAFLVLAMVFPLVQRQQPALRRSLALAALSIGWWLAAPFGWLGGFGLLLAVTGIAQWRPSSSRGVR
jgi:hypothetical protein